MISPDGRTIDFHALQRGTADSLRTYLLGQVLSFSLLSFGYDPLHATTVVVNGKGIAFLGDCGYGKSTLGAAFLARGFKVLTDDVLALERRQEGWMAHPGPMRLKLFPSVARAVLSRTKGRRLNPGTSKIVMPLAVDEASSRPVPLIALYVLPDPKKPGKVPRVRVSTVAGQRAFLEITRAAFNLIQVDRARLERQFRMATRLAGDVPVRRLSYPRRLSALDKVCDAVIADAAGLMARRRPQTDTTR